MTGTTPPTYAERIEKAIRGRDPIEVLRTTPDKVRRMVESAPLAALTARPFPGKWTPCEIIGHLVDAELVFGVRLRLMLAEDEPALPNWDQDAWVARQRYSDSEPTTLAAQFTFLRQINLPLWTSLTDSDLARGGAHPLRGRETISGTLRTTAGHDLLHLDQLQRYIDAARQ